MFSSKVTVAVILLLLSTGCGYVNEEAQSKTQDEQSGSVVDYKSEEAIEVEEDSVELLSENNEEQSNSEEAEMEQVDSAQEEEVESSQLTTVESTEEDAGQKEEQAEDSGQTEEQKVTVNEKEEQEPVGEQDEQEPEEEKEITYEAEPFENKYEMAASAGNIRTGPDVSFNRVTSVHRYTELDAFEKATVGGTDWYHVEVGNEKTGWVSSTIVTEYDPELAELRSNLIDIPVIAQMPELPRGCEVTSLAMLLLHAGISVDKMTLADQVRKDPTKYQRIDGQVHFGNPNDGFVGNMYTFDKPGLGVYHRPIADLAREYLGDQVVDLTGQGFESVYEQLDNGKPVWVINTSEFRFLNDSYWTTWQTPTGPVKITYKMHAVVVTGYDEDYIYFNDPLTVQKNRKVAKASFIAGWEQFGSQAISYGPQ
ncbi:C39 family peptidase [Aquibacillus albus]|uniref:Uncharacterized protein YvpB n=1 Tax=Aquibacillus albus TaxID=1168171 RepID=A0ABS2N4C6_9BACI|nr:C39 family peptidase [Aquibacillus albus]MBM7572745.1 uncharacterized protein YvpB [Aquibacillus albus]